VHEASSGLKQKEQASSGLKKNKAQKKIILLRFPRGPPQDFFLTPTLRKGCLRHPQDLKKNKPRACFAGEISRIF